MIWYMKHLVKLLSDGNVKFHIGKKKQNCSRYMETFFKIKVLQSWKGP